MSKINCPHGKNLEEYCPYCVKEYTNYITEINIKHHFKEPLTLTDYPPAHNPIQELLDEKLSKAYRQINRHIEDTYNDITQDRR